MSDGHDTPSPAGPTITAMSYHQAANRPSTDSTDNIRTTGNDTTTPKATRTNEHKGKTA